MKTLLPEAGAQDMHKESHPTEPNRMRHGHRPNLNLDMDAENYVM